jgi:hypothetical protein
MSSHALEQDVAAGIEHLCDEVLPAFAKTGGAQGLKGTTHPADVARYPALRLGWCHFRAAR